MWSEAGVFLGEALPQDWARRLVTKADTVYQHNERFRRMMRASGTAGRDWLWVFMRHWLAARLYKHRPDLYARLPASYAKGEPLPDAMLVGSAGAVR